MEMAAALQENSISRNLPFPLAQNDPGFLKSNREKTTLTWIGHATVLLQLKGKTY
jgi:hypothetical protein